PLGRVLSRVEIERRAAAERRRLVVLGVLAHRGDDAVSLGLDRIGALGELDLDLALLRRAVPRREPFVDGVDLGVLFAADSAHLLGGGAQPVDAGRQLVGGGLALPAREGERRVGVDQAGSPSTVSISTGPIAMARSAAHTSMARA